MIVVRVELHSAVTREVSELARMTLCHERAYGRLRDYSCTVLRGRSAKDLDKGVVQRTGAVTGHPSEAVHVWNLVAKALAGMGYGR